MEVETQLQIAANLGYIEQVDVERLLECAAEIGRMLNGLSRSINKGFKLTTDN
jgi:four helix bundle protein